MPFPNPWKFSFFDGKKKEIFNCVLHALDMGLSIDTGSSSGKVFNNYHSLIRPNSKYSYLYKCIKLS